MTQAISEIVNMKPSKSLAVTYLIFGYVIGTFITTPLNLSIEEKLMAALTIGSILVTFLFYLKPLERLIGAILYATGTDKTHYFSLTYRKTAMLESPYLRTDLAKIYGAFFFAISIILSTNILPTIGLRIPLWAFSCLQLLSVVLVFGRDLLLLRKKRVVLLGFITPSEKTGKIVKR